MMGLSRQGLRLEVDVDHPKSLRRSRQIPRITALGSRARRARWPLPRRPGNRTAAPASATPPSSPACGAQSRQFSEGRAILRSPTATRNSGRSIASAWLLNPQAESSNQCSESAGTRTSSRTPPQSRPNPQCDTSRAAAPVPHAAPSANYQSVLRCETPSAALSSFYESSSDSFCAPQLRTSRTWVRRDFFCARLEYVFGQHLERALTLSLLKRVLD